MKKEVLNNDDVDWSAVGVLLIVLLIAVIIRLLKK